MNQKSYTVKCPGCGTSQTKMFDVNSSLLTREQSYPVCIIKTCRTALLETILDMDDPDRHRKALAESIDSMIEKIECLMVNTEAVRDGLEEALDALEKVKPIEN